MAGGSLRIKFKPQEGKDYTKAQSVTDGDGYEWNFGQNETKVIPDVGINTTLAANATVKWGADTQQLDSPNVIADIDDVTGRS